MLLALILPFAGAAQPDAGKSIKVIEIKGHIGPGLVQKLRSVLEDTDHERFPAGALLLIDSVGGDGLAAIEIGRMARAARAHVFVRGRCASACVFVLAGGVVRGSATGHAIAIHRPRLTTFVKGIGVVDIDPASNPDAARALEAGNRRTEEFLREMGLPDALFQAMMAVPSNQTKFLNEAELVEFGLLGFDHQYREARAPEAASHYKVSEEEFVRRTMLVHRKCVDGYATTRVLVRCYRRVLQTGE